MVVFSKPIPINTMDKKTTNSILTSANYFKNKINLKKYKLPELKDVVKHYRLARTGNKNVLIERIENHFSKMIMATNIQKIFRGFIVRLSFQLRGDAFKTRTLCVNDTDFISLEPLSEIPFEQFFSFKDSSNFIYGFNISSLIQLMKNTGQISNPYNRTKLDIQVVVTIIRLNNIIQIIFPDYKDINNLQIIIDRPTSHITNITTTTSTNNSTTANNIVELRNNHNIDVSLRNRISDSYYRPIMTNPITMTIELRTIYNKLIQYRLKPVSNRITDLFIDIDLLGNYTQSSWFTNLDRVSYIRFYRILYDIWNYRGQLSRELKLSICPFFEPFSNIFVRQIYHTDITYEEIQFACLTVIENLIYTGIDEDHRKLGALHVLSALTLVSSGARTALTWLYESVVF
jgi:hypothetical protein